MKSSALTEKYSRSGPKRIRPSAGTGAKNIDGLRVGSCLGVKKLGLGFTHRLLSSSFLGLPYRILNMNHKKELLRRLWVGSTKMPTKTNSQGLRV